MHIAFLMRVVITVLFLRDVAVAGILEPLAVHQVVAGDLDVHFLGFLRLHHLDEFGGGTGPHLVGADFGAAQNYGTGGHQGAFAYLGVVHHDGAHAYQRVIAYLGAVYHHVVADGHVVADLDGGFLIQCMKHRAVLDVDAVADGDGVHVAAQYGAVPYGALVAHGHVADNHGIVGDETVLAYFGCEAAHTFDYCH